MLTYLRRHSKGILAYVAFGAIIFVFVLWGGSSYMSREANKVAKVDRTIISVEQYSKAYTETLKAFQKQFGQALTPELIEGLNLREKVLDDLVDQYIIEADAKKMGIVVKEEDLQHFISQVDIFRRDGAFDETLYRRYLEYEGMTPAQFEDKTRKNFLKKLFFSLISENVTVTSDEIEALYHLMNDTYDLNYLVVSPQDFLASVQVGDDEVKKFFEENKERYRVPARITVTLVDFPTSRYLDQARVSEEEARDYFESHKGEFSRPEAVQLRNILITVPEGSDAKTQGEKTALAERIMAEIKAGKDFAALAKTYSEDPTSGPKGGDLGEVPLGSLPEEIAKAVSGMQPGDVKGPFRSKNGLHIVKLEARKAAKETPFEEVAQAIVGKLSTQRAKIVAREEAKKAFMELYESKKPDVEAFAKARGLAPRIVGPASEEELKAAFIEPEAVKKAFTFATGELGEVVETPEGYALYQVSRKELSRIPELKDIAALVREDAKVKAAARQALEHARKLCETETARLVAMNPQSTGEFTRSAASVPGLESIKGLMDQVDDLTKPKAFDAGTKAYVVWIKSRKAADPKDLSPEKARELRESLLETKRDLVVKEYLAQAKDDKRGWHKVRIERDKIASHGGKGQRGDTPPPEGLY
ncbi:MAG TPA: SurA N-terminal domain-containing protein [Deltaproteobacteria bacterium]|nr:SurA N-terminal domain-containing protein [Deltaproteobacteria bacterium]